MMAAMNEELFSSYSFLPPFLRKFNKLFHR